jgi:hypothetical protein
MRVLKGNWLPRSGPKREARPPRRCGSRRRRGDENRSCNRAPYSRMRDSAMTRSRNAVGSMSPLRARSIMRVAMISRPFGTNERSCYKRFFRGPRRAPPSPDLVGSMALSARIWTLKTCARSSRPTSDGRAGCPNSERLVLWKSIFPATISLYGRFSSARNHLTMTAFWHFRVDRLESQLATDVHC